MSGLIDPTTTILTQALNGLSDQQAVISANLSNIDTPNYQPQALDFQTALQNEMAAAVCAPRPSSDAYTARLTT